MVHPGLVIGAAAVGVWAIRRATKQRQDPQEKSDDGEDTDAEESDDQEIAEERPNPNVSASYGSTDAEFDHVKYDGEEAQRAHESAMDRDFPESLAVGSIHEAGVLEVNDNGRRREARVKVDDVTVFVDSNVPDELTHLDNVRLEITSHSQKGNAAHARFLGYV